jgi:hypothetical protein
MPADDQIQALVDSYQKLSNRVEFLQDDMDLKEESINAGLALIDDLTKAKWLLTEAQKVTQQKFKLRVEALVTMAIKAVFDRPFAFELVFERKRDKMECRPVIYEMVDGEKCEYDDPEYDVGGGILDVISLAFKIVLWSMERPRSRNVMILDEPGKNLGDLVPLFGNILRQISHELKIQFIIITHDPALIEIADRSYHVEHDGYESHVTLIQKTADDIMKEKAVVVLPDTTPRRRRR